ncbi:uncharacterized protein trim33l isoform 2-T2 [Odontesthes bonariensis]|uniref:uncharacterized protein trim33l isoform X2 n=1 Tax=Odontesthes bonariensis TaxID=219752 RepID=UPI003F5804AD
MASVVDMDTAGEAGDIPNQQCSNCDGLSARCWCLDCNEALCDECVSAHRRVTLTRSHRLLNQLPEEHSWISPTKFCRLHPFEPLQLFCFTCRQLTCRDCQLVAHMNHRFQFSNEALESLRKELDACIQPLRAQMDASRKSLQDMDKRLSVLVSCQMSVTTGLKKYFSLLVLRLKGKIEHMMNEIQVCELERERLNMRKLKVKQLQQSYISASENAEKARNTTELLALVANISQISSQVKELSEQDTSPPETMSDLMVIINKQSVQNIVNFGKLRISWIPFSVPQKEAETAASDSAPVVPTPPTTTTVQTTTNGVPPAAASTSSTSSSSSSPHEEPVSNLQTGTSNNAAPPVSSSPPPPYASHSSSTSSTSRPPTSTGTTRVGASAPPVARSPKVSPCSLLYALLSSSSSINDPPTSTRQPPSSSSSSSSSVAPPAPPGEPPSAATTAGSDSAIKINVLTKSQVVDSSLLPSWKMRKKKASEASTSVSSTSVSSTSVSSTSVRPQSVSSSTNSTSSPAVLSSSILSSSSSSSSIRPLVSCPAPTCWLLPRAAPPAGQSVAVRPLRASPLSLLLNQPVAPSRSQSSVLLLSDPRTMRQASNSSLRLLSAAPQRCDLVFFSVPKGQKNGERTYFGPVSINLQALPGTSGGDCAAPTNQQILTYKSHALPPSSSCPDDQPRHPQTDGQLRGEELGPALSDGTQSAGKWFPPTSTCSEDSLGKPLSSAASDEEPAPEDGQPAPASEDEEPAPASEDEEPAPASEDGRPLWLAEEPGRPGTLQRDLVLLRSEPRVSLFKLPISLAGRGGPLPRFRLTFGDQKDEVYLEEIAGDSQSIGDMLDDITGDSADDSDDSSDVTTDFTMPLSSPMSLELLSCSACGSPDSSKICSACGRGYHRDCHVPPVGPDIWSEWICSLCQDLSDPSDPYGSDRPEAPRSAGLSLQDQRRCESLLLHLKVEGCSRFSEFGFWSDLVLMSERLTHHRSPPYQTAAQLISEVWSLFEDVSQDDALQKLQQSFQKKLVESLGSELHPSLLIAPNAETPPSPRSPSSDKDEKSDTSKVKEEAELMSDSKLKNLRKRLRDFLGLRSQSAAKREKRE